MQFFVFLIILIQNKLNQKNIRNFIYFILLLNLSIIKIFPDKELIINSLEQRKTPFYFSLKNTVKYASIGDD